MIDTHSFDNFGRNNLEPVDTRHFASQKLVTAYMTRMIWIANAITFTKIQSIDIDWFTADFNQFLVEIGKERIDLIETRDSFVFAFVF
ncbi:hypothetical protein C486_02238 [Natrinema gari JCM 14663]|uniref:Uncharacterized protein n=1 Tax=Natrinema gari JCM 14663 TaxID=1230459 RepID=L9ZE55_9EURY|nr:hypothetical protein C486_02238 [Natrinema gari JCM 14663]